MTASDPASFPPPRVGPSVAAAMPAALATPQPTVAVDPALLTAPPTGAGEFSPRMPVRASDPPPVPAAPRPVFEEVPVEPDEPLIVGRHFHARRPIPDLGALVFVVLVPLALAVVALLAGLHFQRIVEMFDRGEKPLQSDVIDPVTDLTRYIGAIAIVGIVALCMWSFLVVVNTNRVCHTLTTPWFAVVGWLIAPGLGLVAHKYLDKRLDSGSLIGLTVFLAAIYVPFGTLGGAAKDLGGNAHLARTWYLASVIGGFLLIVGLEGPATGLSSDNPKSSMEIRSFACYLAGIMFVVGSALSFATARNLAALIHHRWLRESDPTGTHHVDPMTVTRSGRKLRRRLTPTLFLRIMVTAGLAVGGTASVIALFQTRAKAFTLTAVYETAHRQQLLDEARMRAAQIGVVALLVHAVYVVWAIVAARNAHRRSLMAPTPWAVVASFLMGPLVAVVGLRLGGPLGAAVLVVGIAMTICGFIVGQLVLGRTVTSLGGQGRIFLGWLVVDFMTGIIAAISVRYSNSRIQVIAFGSVQLMFVAISAAMAWTAMTRLDRTVRDYWTVDTPGRPRDVQPASESLTSSHS